MTSACSVAFLEAEYHPARTQLVTVLYHYEDVKATLLVHLRPLVGQNAKLRGKLA